MTGIDRFINGVLVVGSFAALSYWLGGAESLFFCLAILAAGYRSSR